MDLYFKITSLSPLEKYEYEKDKKYYTVSLPTLTMFQFVIDNYIQYDMSIDDRSDLIEKIMLIYGIVKKHLTNH